jgi:hypothetical protein
MTTLQYFRNEYQSHIEEGKCEAGVCKIHAREEAPQ